MCWIQTVYVSHYDRKFFGFPFLLRHKFDKGTNSGLFFHIAKPNDGGSGGFEIQVLDSFGKATSRFECGSLYEFLAPTKQTVKPAGEWNQLRSDLRWAKVQVILMASRLSTPMSINGTIQRYSAN